MIVQKPPVAQMLLDNAVCDVGSHPSVEHRGHPINAHLDERFGIAETIAAAALYGNLGVRPPDLFLQEVKYFLRPCSNAAGISEVEESPAADRFKFFRARIRLASAPAASSWRISSLPGTFAIPRS